MSAIDTEASTLSLTLRTWRRAGASGPSSWAAKVDVEGSGRTYSFTARTESEAMALAVQKLLNGKITDREC